MPAIPAFQPRLDLASVPFRLTLESGVGVSTSDQTGKSTIYWTPYGGNQFALYNGSSWREYTSTELSLSLSGLTPFRLYDIFVYDNSGVLTLEALGWTAPSSAAITGCTNATPAVVTSNGHGLAVDDLVYISGVGGSTGINCATGVPWRIKAVTANTFTLQTLAAVDVAAGGAYTSGGTWYKVTTGGTRATALATQDGVLVQTGALTKRYLGTFCTTSATTTEDSVGKRFVVNYHNRRWRKMSASNTTGHTYNGGFRQWNNDFAHRIWCALPDAATLSPAGFVQATPGSGSIGSLGLGLNSPTTQYDYAYISGVTTSFRLPVAKPTDASAGLNYISALEYTASLGTSTFSEYSLACPLEG